MSLPTLIKSRYENLLLMGITGYFLFLMIPWLGNDLWSDEFSTVRKFCLVSLRTTVTDYSSTNHVLYDLFNNCFLRLLHVRDMTYILEHPWVLRLPMLLFSLFTLLIVYYTAKLVQGKQAGIIAVAVLSTTIPFQNFCLQIRGYEFTIFFDLLLMYSSLHFLTYGIRSYLILMALSSFAAVYSIQSNIYCVIGIVAFMGFEYLISALRDRDFAIWDLAPIGAVLTGMAMALFCYLPIYKEVFTNHLVTGQSPPFRLANIHDATSFYSDFSQGRRLLYLLFGISAILYLTPVMSGYTNLSRTWRMTLWQLAAPILIITALGQHPPARVFIYFCSLPALLISVNLVFAMRLLFADRYHSAMITLLLLFLIYFCQHDRKFIVDHMSENIRKGITEANLRYDFYLHDYHPLSITHFLQQQSNMKPAPIIIKPFDMYPYLNAYHIPYHSMDSMDHFLARHMRVLLITIDPHKPDSALLSQHRCSVREVLPPSYHHLMQIVAQ